MKNLRNVALTIATLLPLAELLFLPLYLAHRTTTDLNQFTGTYMICTMADSGCPVTEATAGEPWR